MSNKSIVEFQEPAPKKEKKPRSEKQQLNDKKLKEKFEAYHRNKKEKNDQLKAIMDEELIELELEKKVEIEKITIVDIKTKPSTFKKNNKKYPATNKKIKNQLILSQSSIQVEY